MDLVSCHEKRKTYHYFDYTISHYNYRQANYIAKVWQVCFETNIIFDDISNDGWSFAAQIV